MQLVLFALLFLIHFIFVLGLDSISHTLLYFYNWLVLILPILIIAYVTKQIIQRAKEIELSSTGIRIKNIEISINQIEKIIVQGYFV